MSILNIGFQNTALERSKSPSDNPEIKEDWQASVSPLLALLRKFESNAKQLKAELKKTCMWTVSTE